VFGADYDPLTTFKFAQFLNKHGIKSYQLKSSVNAGKQSFKPASAYVVPLDQPQYRLIKSIFSFHTNPKDSIFYDISAWNIPQAYNLPFEAVATSTGISGDAFSPEQEPKGKIIGAEPTNSYIFKWETYLAPRALERLLKEDILVKVASKAFETLDGQKFDRGSILIPLGSINTDKPKVDRIINEITQNDGVDVYRVSTGDNKATDLGSSYFSVVTKPRIAILTEDGVNSISAGQVWHLLDTKYDVPATLLPVRTLKQVSLEKYNVLVIPAGSYQELDEKVAEKIQNWVGAGNTLIALENASNWLVKNKLIQAEYNKDDAKAIGLNYENAQLFSASREVPGSVFETKLDLTHPINYGYKTDRLPVFKDNEIIQLKAENIAANYPAVYTKSPLLDGYAPKAFVKTLGDTPSLGIFGVRRGRIIAFYNSTNFRGYWLGTNRQLANGLFFGDKIRLGGGFGRE